MTRRAVALVCVALAVGALPLPLPVQANGGHQTKRMEKQAGPYDVTFFTQANLYAGKAHVIWWDVRNASTGERVELANRTVNTTYYDGNGTVVAERSRVTNESRGFIWIEIRVPEGSDRVEHVLDLPNGTEVTFSQPISTRSTPTEQDQDPPSETTPMVSTWGVLAATVAALWVARRR